MVAVVVAGFPLEVLILQVAEFSWLVVCSFAGHSSKEARGQEISAASPAVILPPYQGLRARGEHVCANIPIAADLGTGVPRMVSARGVPPPAMQSLA